MFVHQHFLCVEVDVDTNIPATCWLSTWWDCSNIYMWIVCSWCIPDIIVIWYRIKSQSGKASEIVTVVVQCDGSQGDSCEEYEQQLRITPNTPPIINVHLTGTVLVQGWNQLVEVVCYHSEYKVYPDLEYEVDTSYSRH